MKKIIPILSIVILIIVFFWQYFIKGLLPIPGDTIVGLYHPFRDLYAKDYPNGIPFKNFLITDPVRQQYPWRELAVSSMKKLEIPLWNPYSFGGTPLLANFQSSVFYPLNFLFFLLPFYIGWSMLIFFEVLLGGVFIYLYLDNLRLSRWANILGFLTFVFSGFSVAWMEWGTILSVGVWLPLVLLSIDKIVLVFKRYKFSIFNFQFSILIWSFIFVVSLVSSFFAGHLQIFFYLFIVSLVYFFVRWFQYGKNKRVFSLFIINYSIFILVTTVQWFPTLQFIFLSARDIDQVSLHNPGWFIPWQHLIQFIAPDFFGNPTTLNYWGVWNYGEFIGYVGIVPLIMAIFALFFRHDKKTFFFGIVFFISLVFSLPTFFAKLPYILNIPFLSTTQPTRLLFIVDFSLAILASLGFDYFIRSKKRGIVYPLIFIFFMLVGLWGFVIFGNEIAKNVTTEDILVAKRNLIFPTLIFIVSAFLLLTSIKFSKSHKSFTVIIYVILVGLAVFDLMRFGAKFTSFTKKEYLFPQTKTISFLQKDVGNYRIMATDSRILPPNFSAIYRLQSADGYDPLYLRRYGELIAASERGKPNISPPFGFNRIIAPHNYDSKIIDLLGIKFVLSLSDLDSPKLKKVFQEGQTRIYENSNAFPRAFFVDDIYPSLSEQETIDVMFGEELNLRKIAIIEDKEFSYGKREMFLKPMMPVRGTINIINYSENKVIINTESDRDAWLVLVDSFYPTWKVKVNNIEKKIYRADYNFRGVNVPKGKTRVEFYNTLL